MQIAKNIASGWVVFGVKVLTTLVLTPFILVELGKEDYGLWALIISLAALLELLDFGMSNGLRRYYSQAIGKRDQKLMQSYLDAAASIFVVLAILVLLISIVLMFAGPSIANIPPDRVDQFRVVMFLLGIRAAVVFVLKPYGGVIAANERYDIIYFIELVSSILSALLMVAALVLGFGILGLAIATLATASLANITEYFVAQKKYGPLKPKISLRRTQYQKALLSYSAIMIVITICDYAKGNLNNILVSAFTDLTSVVYYAIAFQLITYLIQLLTVVTITFMPRFSRLQGEGNFDELREQVMQGAKLSSGVLAFMLVMVWFTGEQFLQTWLDESFSLSYQILQILIPAMAMANSLSVLVSYLYATSKHALYAKISVVEIMVDVSISVYLLQKMGVLGAAWGTFVATIFIRFFWLLFAVCRELDIPVLNFVARAYGRVVLFGAAFVLVSIAVGRTPLMTVDGWLDLLLLMTSLSSIGLLLIWFVLLDAAGRDQSLKVARAAVMRSYVK